jgi:hypothetical protein
MTFADAAVQVREALMQAPDFRYVNPRSYEVWWKGVRAGALEAWQEMLEETAREAEVGRGSTAPSRD